MELVALVIIKVMWYVAAQYYVFNYHSHSQGSTRQAEVFNAMCCHKASVTGKWGQKGFFSPQRRVQGRIKNKLKFIITLVIFFMLSFPFFPLICRRDSKYCRKLLLFHKKWHFSIPLKISPSLFKLQIMWNMHVAQICMVETCRSF